MGGHDVVGTAPGGTESGGTAAVGGDPRARLRGDCASCLGLCCVAPALTASADFAISKPAGRPCRNLRPDFRCGIHARLRERGFPGCTVFDCFGSGQVVGRETFPGQDWRSSTDLAAQMFEVFGVQRQLHEMLWYLVDALTREAACELHPALREQVAQTERFTRRPPDELVALDVPAHRDDVNRLLLRTSELVRTADGRPGRNHRGADLITARLHGADLRGADLRGAYLLGAELGEADLRRADLIGADLRGADVRGADLREALFLTQPQVDAACGDARTRLPGWAVRPQHWTA
jgi:hypothetical protein